MAIRRLRDHQPLGPRPRLDRVTTRSEIRLRIGTFQLLLRRVTTVSTITLPGCPLSEIHHWGVLADEPDPQPKKGLQISKEGLTLLAQMRAERNQGRRDWRSMSPEFQARFKAHLAKLFARGREKNQPTERDDNAEGRTWIDDGVHLWLVEDEGPEPEGLRRDDGGAAGEGPQAP